MPIVIAKDLAYPIIEFGPKGAIVSAHAGEKTLTTMTALALKHGGLTGSTLVDSNGRAFIVMDTRFVSGRGSFWGYTLFLDRVIEVELLLGDSREVPLEEIKERILRGMRQGAGSMDPAYVQNVKASVTEAGTPREMIDAVLPIYDTREFWRRMKRF